MSFREGWSAVSTAFFHNFDGFVQLFSGLGEIVKLSAPVHLFSHSPTAPDPTEDPSLQNSGFLKQFFSCDAVEVFVFALGFRRLVAKKFDGSIFRKKVGRPQVNAELESLIVKFAEENPSWGYDRIEGALSNLGYRVSDQTVGNILKRNGIPPVPNRTQDTTWSKFIKDHQDVLAACDFFTVEVITPVGLITYYVLFFINIGSRKVHIAGITTHPNERWMVGDSYLNVNIFFMIEIPSSAGLFGQLLQKWVSNQ